MLFYRRRRFRSVIWVGIYCLVVLVIGGKCLSLPEPETSSLTPSKTRRRLRDWIPILQYHDSWVCVNKPEGLTTHRSMGVPKHRPVLTTTVKRQLSRKVFPVHRLDHRTSGAMLFAFNSEMAGKLHSEAIRNGKKQYIALVRGEWKGDEEAIADTPLLVHDTMKDARTSFRLLATMDGESERSSLLLCEPLTGRTHQIRRHAAALGHPVIGDTQHGDSRSNRWWRENKGLDRLALHYWTLEFNLNGQRHFCLAPLSDNFRGILQTTSLWETAITKAPMLTEKAYDEVGGTFGRNYKKRKDIESF